MQVVSRKNNMHAKRRALNLADQKQKYNEFYVKRWEVFRKVENDRID